MTDKIALRRHIRGQRLAFARGLSDAERTALADGLVWTICDRIPPPAILGSYVAMPGEIDPLPVADAYRRRGSHIAYPLVNEPGAPLSFHRVDDHQSLRAGFARIPEPPRSAPVVEPDLLLVPLVAADAAGNRLGMGAGFYDRTLAALSKRKHFTAIGLAWDLQILHHLPHDPWDVPLHAIATPTRWIVPHGSPLKP